MKISAIICEFNPLHCGHKRLIEYAKGISDKVICIMSGNFVQRGMPACANKFDRARHAVLCGADLVVELPTIFATASAENFAEGATRIADKLHADYLVFGSECGSIEQLTHACDMLASDELNASVKALMKTGTSYPKALATALDSNIADSPNNVLGIEYLRAIRKISSHIVPITIKRENNYNAFEAMQYASSTALRNDISLFARYSYDFVQQDFNNEIEEQYKSFATTYLSLLNSEQLQAIEGVTEGLHNRIIRAEKSNGYEAMLEQIKTKRYTRAKLQRIILNAVLDIKKTDIQQARQADISITPLAVKKGSEELLNRTQKNIEPLTKKADSLYKSLDGKNAPIKLQVME